MSVSRSGSPSNVNNNAAVLAVGTPAASNSSDAKVGSTFSGLLQKTMGSFRGVIVDPLSNGSGYLKDKASVIVSSATVLSSGSSEGVKVSQEANATTAADLALNSSNANTVLDSSSLLSKVQGSFQNGVVDPFYNTTAYFKGVAVDQPTPSVRQRNVSNEELYDQVDALQRLYQGLADKVERKSVRPACSNSLSICGTAVAASAPVVKNSNDKTIPLVDSQESNTSYENNIHSWGDTPGSKGDTGTSPLINSLSINILSRSSSGDKLSSHSSHGSLNNLEKAVTPQGSRKNSFLREDAANIVNS